MAISWFPYPPPVSPSAVPALGVGLCLNTLLAVGFSFLVSNQADFQDEFIKAVFEFLLPSYAILMLPLAGLYGLAAAAWVGWSWWRVPAATFAATALGWSVNVLCMAWWAKRKNWDVLGRFSWEDPKLNSLGFACAISLLVLLALLATVWRRDFNKPD